jgi:hypothetical protein
VERGCNLLLPLAELREALSHDRDRTILDQFERLLCAPRPRALANFTRLG